MPKITVKYRIMGVNGHVDPTCRPVYVKDVTNREELVDALKNIPKGAIVLYVEGHVSVTRQYVNDLFR